MNIVEWLRGNSRPTARYNYLCKWVCISVYHSHEWHGQCSFRWSSSAQHSNWWRIRVTIPNEYRVRDCFYGKHRRIDEGMATPKEEQATEAWLAMACEITQTLTKGMRDRRDRPGPVRLSVKQEPCDGWQPADACGWMTTLGTYADN